MRAEGNQELEPADVKVGEVGGVGFVQVVVAFEEAGAGGGDEGLEERRGAGGGCQAEARGAEVGEEAFEQADLGGRMLVEIARTGGRGRSLRVLHARRRASS